MHMLIMILFGLMLFTLCENQGFEEVQYFRSAK